MRKAIWFLCAVVAAACGSRSADAVSGGDGGVFRRGLMVSGDGGPRPGSDALPMAGDARQEDATAVLGDVRLVDVAVPVDARSPDMVPVDARSPDMVPVDTRSPDMVLVDAVPWGVRDDAGDVHCPSDYYVSVRMGSRGRVSSELCYVPGVSSTCFRDLTGALVEPCRYASEVIVSDCSDCPRFYRLDGGAR